MTALGNEAAAADRLAWLDVARGIGIILVVNGHVLDGLRNASMVGQGYGGAWSYVLYTFHMPLFFYLAGLNVERSLRRGRRAFILTKAWSLLYPYVVWSVLQGSLSILLASRVNEPMTVRDLLDIWYRPIGQFWFLYALMICHLLAAALLPSRGAVAAVAACALAAAYTVPSLQIDVAVTLHHLPFYAASFYLHPSSPERRGSWGPVVSVWLGFAAAAFLGGAASHLEALSVFSLPAGVLGVAGTVLLARRIGPASPRLLIQVGQMSMSIYVMHIMAVAGSRILLGAAHVHFPPLASVTVLTVVGVALPTLAHVILRRLHLLLIFGLAPLGHRASSSPGFLPTPAR